jgi:hypothetical protein
VKRAASSRIFLPYGRKAAHACGHLARGLQGVEGRMAVNSFQGSLRRMVSM